jgi:hypothetical protein
MVFKVDFHCPILPVRYFRGYPNVVLFLTAVFFTALCRRKDSFALGFSTSSQSLQPEHVLPMGHDLAEPNENGDRVEESAGKMGIEHEVRRDRTEPQGGSARGDPAVVRRRISHHWLRNE